MMKNNIAATRRYCPTTALVAPPFLLRPVQLSRRECFVSKRPWSAQVLRHERKKLSISASASSGTKFVAPAIQGSTTGEVFLTGSGPLSARIAQELLQVGFKVTAGVSDLEEAEGLLDFAKRFEIIRKAEISNLKLSEVDFLDEESISATIPKRGARVVVALGDTLGRQRIDAKVALRILEAAKAVNAAQFVLVSSSGASGGGGFLGGLFGGGAPNASKIEQEVVNSGLSCVVLRVGKTEGVDESLGSESAVVLGAQQSLPSQSVITKSQVAQVVAQVMRQAQDDVAVEAWADRNGEPTDVAALVSEVLPKAVIEDSGEADEEPEADAAEVEEEEDAAPIKLPFAFGGQGTKRVKAQPPVAPSRAPAQGTARIKAAVQEEAQKEVRQVGGFFGRAKKAVEEAAEEAEEQPQKKRAAPFANLLGGGAGKVAAKAEAAAQKAEAAAGKQARQAAAAASRGSKRSAAAAEKPAKQARGFFNKAAAAVEEEVDDDANPLSRLLGGGKKAAKQALKAAEKVPAKAERGTARVKTAAAKAALSREAAPKKKGGFLEALGIGQETYYQDE
ncbi:g2424 [Coccomyxa elongata]